MRILVVEDDPASRYLLQSQLEPDGWEVVLAKNGLEALERLEQDEPYDVCLSDILMPQMDGFRLCQEVRRREALRQVPVVFYTATYTDPKEEALGLAMGAARFLRKPLEREELLRILREVLAEGAPAPGAVAAHDKLNEEVTLEVYNQRLVHKLDRKVAQLEQAASELRCILDNTFDEVFVLEARGDDFVYELLNLRATERTGLSSAEIRGKTPEEVFGPEQGQRITGNLLRCAEQGRALKLEEAHSFHGQKRVVFEVSLTPTLDALGVTQRITVFARDITARAQTESELRDAVERLEQAVSAGGVGLWDWDLQTNQVRYSKEWKSQIGYEEDEISDTFHEWESRLHPDDREQALETVRGYLAQSDPHHESEFRFRHKDGSYRDILSRGTEVRDEAGVRVRLLGSHVDVTERNEMQAKFLQSQKMEVVGRLAGGVAHDFNNLLTAILGYSELALGRVRPGDALHRHLEGIRQAGGRASSLTRQLLAFSRRQALDLRVLDLNAVVRDLESMLGRLIGEDVQLEIDTDARSGTIKADPVQVEQVILNLCVNARDAMPRGGRLLLHTANAELSEEATGFTEDVKPGSYVMFAVSDSGSGMSEDVLQHAFEPFYTTKEVGKGTGLGLATVYAIVTGAGGQVSISSEPNVGTTFRVYFPRCAEAVQARSSIAEVPARHGGETILLVEDNDLVRELSVRVLESGGYTVVSAADGEAALRAFEHSCATIDLLLTDAVLPNMSGSDLARRLVEAKPNLRVLLCSGYSTNLSPEKGVGSSAFLAKPFTPEAILTKVREVLDARAPA